MKELDKLVENFLQPKSERLSINQLSEMINEVISEQERRFSMTIPIPKLTPTEAWGDPNSQSRQEIDKIFASISGGADIKERIQNINRFLNPESATRKRSPSNILNMMMITEALQATPKRFWR